MADMRCTKHKFRCGDGRCIPKAWLCDKEHDCEDKSDESLQHCGKYIYVSVLMSIYCIYLSVYVCQ